MTEPPQPDQSPPSGLPDQPGPNQSGWDTARRWFDSLYRSSDDKLLAGVCGGLARRMALPPLLVRIAFVLALFFGIGVPLYVIAWVVVPTDRGERLLGRGPVKDLVAVGLIAVSVVILLGTTDGIDVWSVAERSLPWLVILGGLALVMRRADSSKRNGSERYVAEREGQVPPPTATTSALSVPASQTIAPQQLGAQPPPMSRPVKVRSPRPKPVLGPLTWCAVLVVVGVMAALATAGIDPFTPGVIGAAALIVFGLGLTTSAWRGRARGLILPALALGLLLAGLAAIDTPVPTLSTGFDRTIAEEADLPELLETGVGSSDLDLRSLELSSDRTVRITQVAGDMTVVLPTDVTTRVTVDVEVGTAQFERPSIAFSMYSMGESWLRNGVPKEGDPVDASSEAGYPNNSRGWADHVAHVIDNGSDAVLTLDLRLGTGTMTIIDPHWTDTPGKIVTPAQLCTIAGGARGVVEPCSQVPEASRVALCLNDSGFAVDCREDRVGTYDYPRIAACRSFDGSYVDCQTLGLDPVGAQLISPDQPINTDDTIAPLDGDGAPLDGDVTTETTVPLPDPNTPPTVAPPAPAPTVEGPT